MFRVVRAFVPTPRFWMVCDEVTCAMMIGRPINFAGALVTIGSDNRVRIMQEDQKAFLDEARKQGWLVSLGAMFCPAHYQTIQQAQKEQGDQRIVVPQIH